MKAILSCIFFLLVAVVTNTAALSVAHAATFIGRVVDAETGEPLEGAVVMIQWWKYSTMSFHGRGPRYFHTVREELTDAEGKFSVYASSGPDWSPVTYVDNSPDLVVYKPGYRMLYESVSQESVRHGALVAGATLYLTKLKTREQLQRFTRPSWFDVPICGGEDFSKSMRNDCIPKDRVPHFVRQMSMHLKLLGR